MSRFFTFVAVAAGSLVAAGCASGLGSASPRLVELYDDADPAGLIEIELDRRGTIIEMEADVLVSDLPDAVLAAARAALGGAEITGAEREIHPDRTLYEVKFRENGRDGELLLDDRGVIRETERELSEAEAPAAVLESATAAVPGGAFKSVELIEIGSERLYHVKLLRDGASYKIVLDPAGNVLRKVREHRAEIEIPLR